MMYNKVSEIVAKADILSKEYCTRNPFVIADGLGIKLVHCNFKEQKGAYTTIMRNRFIFYNQNLEELMLNIVIAHEIGHDLFHRAEAATAGGLKEFNLFNMQNIRMEYEANIFASELLLDTKEFLEYCEYGYDTQQIASAMNSDINLVGMKANTLISQGYRLRQQEQRSDFLKF